jgi:hypothetical protein
MLLEGSDLVTTLDRITVLYAPILASWMEEHPDVHMIVASIGADDHSAFAECADGQPYSDAGFEQAASEALRTLSDQASVIQPGCSVLRDVAAPFDVTAVREEDSIRVTAYAADIFEAATVSRSVIRRPGKDVFFAETCQFEMKTLFRDTDLIPGFMASAERGMSEMLEFAISNRIVANLPDGEEAMLREWVAAFPTPMRVSVKNFEGFRDVLVVRVRAERDVPACRGGRGL